MTRQDASGASGKPSCDLQEATPSKPGSAYSNIPPSSDARTRKARAARRPRVAGVAMPDANGAPTVERPSRERKTTARMQQEIE